MKAGITGLLPPSYGLLSLFASGAAGQALLNRENQQSLAAVHMGDIIDQIEERKRRPSMSLNTEQLQQKYEESMKKGLGLRQPISSRDSDVFTKRPIIDQQIEEEEKMPFQDTEKRGDEQEIDWNQFEQDDKNKPLLGDSPHSQQNMQAQQIQQRFPHIDFDVAYVSAINPEAEKILIAEKRAEEFRKKLLEAARLQKQARQELKKDQEVEDDDEYERLIKKGVKMFVSKEEFKQNKKQLKNEAQDAQQQENVRIEERKVSRAYQNKMSKFKKIVLFVTSQIGLQAAVWWYFYLKDKYNIITGSKDKEEQEKLSKNQELKGKLNEEEKGDHLKKPCVDKNYYIDGKVIKIRCPDKKLPSEKSIISKQIKSQKKNR